MVNTFLALGTYSSRLVSTQASCYSTMPSSDLGQRQQYIHINLHTSIAILTSKSISLISLSTPIYKCKAVPWTRVRTYCRQSYTSKRIHPLLLATSLIPLPQQAIFVYVCVSHKTLKCRYILPFRLKLSETKIPKGTVSVRISHIK